MAIRSLTEESLNERTNSSEDRKKYEDANGCDSEKCLDGIEGPLGSHGEDVTPTRSVFKSPNSVHDDYRVEVVGSKCPKKFR